MTGVLPARVEMPTVADTESFGRELARVLRAGDLVLLHGPLGAGKTALARGVGAGLGVAGAVNSPTFVIARVHPGPLPLIHVDAYRLGSLAELDDLDLDVEAPESVTLVEWGRGVAEQLADEHLLIELTRGDDERRVATLTPVGPGWQRRVAR